MTPSDLQILESEIDRAHALVAQGKPDLAVVAFDMARQMAVTLADQPKLTATIEREYEVMGQERESYRTCLAENSNKNGKRLLIMADSLALPRPDRKDTPAKGAEHLYAWHLGAGPQGYNVHLHAQRYYSTNNAVAQLTENPGLAKCDYAIVHMGLNDCTNRMFLEQERLALSLLSDALRTKIVSFAQRNRREILLRLPKRSYVQLDKFQSNLSVIKHLLKSGGCEKILFTTLILPPTRAWKGTPGLNANFASYNNAIFKTANLDDVLAFDYDRFAWGGDYNKTLIEDGMHLSDAGHAMFAQEARNLLE